MGGAIGPADDWLTENLRPNDTTGAVMLVGLSASIIAR